LLLGLVRVRILLAKAPKAAVDLGPSRGRALCLPLSDECRSQRPRIGQALPNRRLHKLYWVADAVPTNAVGEDGLLFAPSPKLNAVVDLQPGCRSSLGLDHCERWGPVCGGVR